jgi:hypothetical protein
MRLPRRRRLYTTVPSFTVAFFSITTIPDLM